MISRSDRKFNILIPTEQHIKLIKYDLELEAMCQKMSA